MSTEHRACAERILDLVRRKGPRDAIIRELAAELAAMHATAVACAVVSVERELAKALGRKKRDDLAPFGEVVRAIERKSSRRHKAR